MPPGAKNSCSVGRARVGLSVGGIGSGRSSHHSDARSLRLAVLAY
jgi:hypothetical protein